MLGILREWAKMLQIYFTTGFTTGGYISFASNDGTSQTVGSQPVNCAHPVVSSPASHDGPYRDGANIVILNPRSVSGCRWRWDELPDFFCPRPRIPTKVRAQ